MKENSLKNAIFWGGLFIAFLSYGCAPQAQIDMLERNVSGLQIETHRIGEEVKGLKREFSQIQGEAAQGSRRSIARLSARVDSLESELNKLNGFLEQIKYNQEREEAELAQLKQEIQALLDRSSRPVAAPTPAPTPTPAVTATAGGQKGSLSQAPPMEERPKAPAKPQDLYKEGLDLFRLKKYQEAKKAFRDFIKQNPSSSMVANAHFWIGECEYRQSRYEEAILEYNKVITKFPKSNKVPDALLKQAFAFAKLGDKESARILLQKLVNKYPSTAQAKAARRQLKLLR